LLHLERKYDAIIHAFMFFMDIGFHIVDAGLRIGCSFQKEREIFLFEVIQKEIF